MFNTSYKKLIKNKIIFSSFIYLGFSLITQIVNLLYTPLLTKHLSQEEYGIYSLLISIEGLISLSLLLCIPSGYSRFYNEISNKKELENSFLNFLILLGMLVLIILFIFSNSINKLMLKDIKNGNLYIILIGVSSYCLGIISLLTIKYSMEFKALKTSLINFSNIFLQYLLIIVILIYKKLTIENILYIKFFVVFLILCILFISNIKYYQLKINVKLIKEPLKFSLGLVLGQASTWILTLIDRQFISGYCGFSDVGIYSLGCKIGMLINPIFIEPLRKIYTPLKFKVYKLKEGRDIINSYYKIYCFLGGFIILSLGLYSNLAINILATKEYMGALYIIPIITTSYFLWGLNEFYALGVVVGNKSVINSVIAFSAALFNIIFNIILIPKIGMYGAAFSSIISYLLTNELYYIFGKKYYNLELKKMEWIKYLIICICIYCLKIIMNKYFNLNILLEGIINVLYLILYITLNIILKNINLKELREIFNYDIN